MFSLKYFFAFFFPAMAILGPVFGQAPSALVTITVTFASSPSVATLAPCDLKYNKEAVINIEWDDNSLGSMTALPLMNSHYFTDGCGNNISYRGALAINGLNNFNNSEWGNNYPGKVSYSQMQTLIAAGWDIENHSEYHEPSGNYSNGTDALKNVRDLTQRLWNRTGYLMSTVVVPTNYTGFVSAARDLNYLSATTQGQKDGIPIYPAESWQKYTETGLLPDGFVQLNREFTDNWPGYLPTLKTRVNEILSGSSASVHKFYRVGTHTIDETAFTEYMDYLQANAADRIWVTTMRELLEYRLLKQQVVKSEMIAGNVLTVTLDKSGVSDKIRFHDMTFKVNADAAISNVTVSGADNSSFNVSSNLVNIFSQRAIFNDPSGVVLPVRWLNFSVAAADGVARIIWKTAEEINADYFVVERSEDGSSFKPIVRIPSKGENQNDYSSTDNTILAGRRYDYRVKQVDKDGKTEYSETKSIRTDQSSSLYLKVKNSPFTNELQFVVTAPESSTAFVRLIHINGMLTHTKKTQLIKGENLITLQTDFLPSGIYSLNVESSGKLTDIKVLKQ